MIQRRTLDTLPVCLLILGQSGDTANRPMSKRVTETSPGFNVEGQRGSKEASEAFRYTLHGKTESSLSLDTGFDRSAERRVGTEGRCRWSQDH